MIPSRGMVSVGLIPESSLGLLEPMSSCVQLCDIVHSTRDHSLIFFRFSGSVVKTRDARCHCSLVGVRFTTKLWGVRFPTQLED